jgi:transposase
VEKYIVTLTSDERTFLQQLLSSGKAAARKLTHARILLLADASPDGPASMDEDIEQALEVGASTIHRVRQRFVLESFDAALYPRPSPARPQKVKIQGAIEQALLELVCNTPPKGRSRWTLQLLAEQLVVLRKVSSVSLETVRQALKKTAFNLG